MRKCSWKCGSTFGAAVHTDARGDRRGAVGELQRQLHLQRRHRQHRNV